MRCFLSPRKLPGLHTRLNRRTAQAGPHDTCGLNSCCRWLGPCCSPVRQTADSAAARHQCSGLQSSRQRTRYTAARRQARGSTWRSAGPCRLGWAPEACSDCQPGPSRGGRRSSWRRSQRSGRNLWHTARQAGVGSMGGVGGVHAGRRLLCPAPTSDSCHAWAQGPPAQPMVQVLAASRMPAPLPLASWTACCPHLLALPANQAEAALALLDRAGSRAAGQQPNVNARGGTEAALAAAGGMRHAVGSAGGS